MIKKITYISTSIIVSPLIIPLLLLKKIKKITFIRIRSRRIGHLASNTELFLRRKELNIIKGSNLKHIGIATSKPCNQPLLEMFQRKFKIITIPLPTLLRVLTQLAANNSILKTLNLFTEPKYKVNDFYEFNNCPPMLKFTDNEEKKGKEILKKMNVDNWFICVNMRDKKYLDTVLKKRDESDDYRNGNIENTIPSLEYIAKQEGYVLRMGAKVEKKLNVENKRIIDYANNWRTEFGDIYLSANCKFFLGDTAGLICLPYIFNHPVALVNVIPLNHPPINKQSIFIPKKIWFKKENRYLTFKEIIEFEKGKYFTETKDYTQKEYFPHENTPAEILDLVIEMNERLNGTWKTTKEDETLQQKFKSLFPPSSHCYGFPSRVGAVFLRENKKLLD